MQNDPFDTALKKEAGYALEKSGPLLILAGPGTGKTHDLARRVRWLVSERIPKISTQNILVVTFTTEATRNMKKRMSDKSKDDVFIPADEQPRVTTLNSLGYEIMRQHRTEVGLAENIDVLPDGPIRDILLADCAQLCGLERKMGKQVADCRRNGECVQDDSKKCEVCEYYIRLLSSLNTIDYDEQILEACRLLRESKALQEKYINQTEALLVDEYQDLNKAQHELIELISRSHRDGLFVVGDDDQSIYEFRGGSLKYIRQFEEDYGKGTVRYKTISRRCTGHILNGALDIITKYNRGRLPGKPSMTAAEEGGPITIHHFPTDTKETEFIARFVKKKKDVTDILILVPNYLYAAPISSALSSANVNHTALFKAERIDLNVIVEVEKWLNDKSNNFLLRLLVERMVDSGYLGIPSAKAKKKTNLLRREAMLSKVSHYWKPVLAKKTLFEAIEDKAESEALGKLIIEALCDIQECRGKKTTDYINALQRYLDIWHGKNDAMLRECEQIISMARTAVGFPNVRIMTMQGAKGLEANCVIIVGLEDGVIPKADLGTQEEELESRLLYVSMTRAKSELHLCHSSNRRGASTFRKQSFALKLSRFTKAISREHINYIRYS